MSKVLPDFYLVEKILDKKINESGTVEYYVKWENYSSSENTWEPECNLSTAKKMIVEYERGLKDKSEGRFKYTNYIYKPYINSKK